MDDRTKRMMKSNLFSMLLLGLFFGLLGCEETSKEAKIQYMPDMADNPTVKAQEDYLDPPDFSVATDAIFYPEDMEVAESKLMNPLGENKGHLVRGKKLYGIYCALCHGPNAKGKGSLTDAYPKAAVPDISRADLAKRKDGFFFVKIAKGGPMMPSYGHATTAEERWQIIMYLRTLQSK